MSIARTRTITAFRFLKIIGNPYGERVAQDDTNNFGPRLGFAWDIMGNGSSVLRGGYGIYYDQSFLNVPLFAVQLANPEIYALIINDSANLSVSSPAPPFPRPLTNPPIGFPINGRFIDPDYESPYTQQFNLGYGVQLAGTWRSISTTSTYWGCTSSRSWISTPGSGR